MLLLLIGIDRIYIRSMPIYW